VVCVQDDLIAPFRAGVLSWLEAHDAPAVLVRPDRYVFGTGEPPVLLAAWDRALGPLRRAA